MRGEKRDYIPSRERDLTERMKSGASLEDGLAGRVTAQQKGAYYRDYTEKGEPRPDKKFQGDFHGW